MIPILPGLLQSKMRTSNGEACINIGHVNINNCKIKTHDASAQTLHLVPYRLKFLPGTDCDVKLGPSEKNCTLRCNCCCRIFSQWILSQVGLSLLVVIWALLGALAFFYTEGKKQDSFELLETLTFFILEIKTILGILLL